jgi:hypothetical protein
VRRLERRSRRGINRARGVKPLRGLERGDRVAIRGGSILLGLGRAACRLSEAKVRETLPYARRLSDGIEVADSPCPFGTGA